MLVARVSPTCQYDTSGMQGINLFIQSVVSTKEKTHRAHVRTALKRQNLTHNTLWHRVKTQFNSWQHLQKRQQSVSLKLKFMVRDTVVTHQMVCFHHQLLSPSSPAQGVMVLLSHLQSHGHP
jgi:hypothetical protein